MYLTLTLFVVVKITNTNAPDSSTENLEIFENPDLNIGTFMICIPEKFKGFSSSGFSY